MNWIARCLTILLLAANIGLAHAGSPYRSYAEGLVANPPAGITIRPDMEAALDVLLNQTRAGRGVKAVQPSPLFKTMARAQAIDMVLGNFVGHNSVRGEYFDTRFNAFTDGVIYRMRAENAARDRQPGPIDAVKAKRLFTQWINSPSHNHTLGTRDYLFVSTGAVAKGNHLYAIQIFWSESMKCGGNILCGNLTGKVGTVIRLN